MKSVDKQLLVLTIRYFTCINTYVRVLITHTTPTQTIIPNVQLPPGGCK